MTKSTLETFGVPLNGKRCGGILMPLPAWRFRVTPQGVGDEARDLFTQQIVNAKMDFLNKRLRVEVRSSVLPECFNAVMRVASAKFAPHIEFLDGGDGVLFGLEFNGAKLTQHDFNFSYADNESAVHVLEWTFSSTNTLRYN